MANICQYKGIVKGKKNACYAFYGSMSTLDYKEIVKEEGTDDDYTLQFEGDCKWSVDAYCNPFQGEKPVELPEDFEEAMELAESEYWYNTVKERSEMFQVEVICNSADIEDYDPEHGPYEIYEHYNSGNLVLYDKEFPEELRIKGW